MNRTGRRLTALALVVAALGVACTDNSTESASGSGSDAPKATKITVDSSDDACKLSATKAPSGNIIFSVTNSGNRVTEFELLSEDGSSIIGEVENIGPGLSRDLVLRADAGTYETACIPGQSGEGVRAPFTVTDSGEKQASTKELQQLEAAATAQYKAYVEQQTDALLAATTTFAEAYKSGDLEKAKSLYAPTRAYYETIEPVAESFGDLDPKLDLREADLEEGQTWTGWHKIEKDLWPPAGYAVATPEQRAKDADQLVADTQELVAKAKTVELKPDQLGNGAKELMDEVATGKVTGEEEAWSHTDLWDFQANVDGARLAYQALRPIVLIKDKELADTLDTQFAAIQTELDKYKVADGFQYYTQLTQEQIKALADSVNALGEPLSKLTSVVVL